ncbi:MAG: hypothetical protein IPN53_16800 [Comamonadaceae bacterium]|nr:hypothetical protein [Comamonadaceae bacterium]
MISAVHTKPGCVPAGLRRGELIAIMVINNIARPPKQALKLWTALAR